MDFRISDKMQKMLADVRAFIDTEAIPVEREVLDKGFKASQPLLQKKRAVVKQLGLWTPQMAVSHGGLGLSVFEHGLVSAELGRSPLGHYLFNCQAPDAGNMEILHLFGTPEQQKTFLDPLVRGDIRSCFSMTEPEFAGSNPTLMATTAVLDGDDYVINGHKWFTTAGDGASFAVVMAITDPAAAKHERASQILVPMHAPGVQLVRNIPIMGEEGDDWLSHAEMRYTDVRVPRKNLLGKEGAGFAIAQERLGPGRIHHCMRWIGICERSFELMVDYAAKREIEPGKVLGTKQTVQNWIAESRAEINAARLMVLHAAWSIDQVGAKAAREEISLIKFFVAGVLQQVVDRAIQVHGALGMTEYTPLSHYYRHERGARIYDGADEVHKTVIARRYLKKAGVAI
jgi:alkylation response protein AidB-like acyl-CoA dehydrogenase